MKLEDQVCSLEYARKLKELGVKQESLWYWCSDTGEMTFSKNCEPYKKAKCGQHLSRFTVAELGEMLPEYIVYKTEFKAGKRKEIKARLEYQKNCLSYQDNTEIVVQFFDATTEANARAKMLIYLLENGLIKH